MSKVTMQDIADHLAISKNSVSQALRNKGGVSEDTRTQVIAAAKQLGYNYETILNKNKSLQILLLSTQFALSQTSFFGEILKSIRETCASKNFVLTVEEITEEMIQKQRLPENINQYDGILILSHSDNSWIQHVIGTAIPTVIIDHHDPRLFADAILTKNTDGAFLAVSELANKGYQTIGFIGDTEFSPSYLERYRGFKRAIEFYELEMTDMTTITQIEENQGALFTKLNQIVHMPDAWFCVNSGLAFMLNSYLQSKGLNIPEDIGIICFDDTEFTRMSQPQLTNVATDLNYMGELSVETLVQRIDQPNAPYVHQQILPTLNLYASI